ncbi:MAG: DUF2911 domain-containing protein [Chryseolinea sp.]
MSASRITFIYCVIAILANLQYASAQGITTPNAPSPAAKVSQTIGISTVTVSYSRPGVKGRKIWGTLVPYGWNVQGFGNVKSAPWRAGANENTVIEFSNDATVEGKKIPAGSYGLFFVINKDNTGEVILSKDSRSWGSFFYEEGHDEMRAPIKIQEGSMTERLSYDFVNVEKSSAQLILSWEKKQFPVSISFDVDAIVMANAREELKGPTGFGWQGFASAANYSLLNKTNQEEGSKWIDQAILQHKSFGTMIVKAGFLEQEGNNAEAEKVKKDAYTVATEAELNAYGYQLLGDSKINNAVDILKMTAERFPKSANAWDSLGEAYAIKGDSKNAVASFKKSLSMSPPDNIKANSEKYLKQLGAMK